MRFVALTFVAFVLVASAAGPALAAWDPQVEGGIELGYRGKYASHPFYRKMMAELPALRRAVVEKVNVTLGVRYVDDYSIILRLADATDTTDVSRENDMKKRGAPNLKSRGRTGNYVLRGKKVVAITFYIEHFVGGTADYRTTIIHELSHGVMRKLIPSEKVRAAIPGWFKEGLATHLAGQLPGRLKIKLASSKKKDPAAPLRGLAALDKEKKPTGDSYYEYALHVTTIDRAPKGRGLKAFYALIAKGVPFKRALKDVSGLGFGAFVAKSDARARRTLEELAEENGWTSWRSARKAAAGGDETRLAAGLRKRPRSIFAGAMKLELARLWLRQKRNAREAARLLAEVRDHHMRDVTSARDTKLFLGKALLRSKQPAEAKTALLEYLRDMVSAKPSQRKKAESLVALATSRMEGLPKETGEHAEEAPLGDAETDAGAGDDSPAHE